MEYDKISDKLWPVSFLPIASQLDHTTDKLPFSVVDIFYDANDDLLKIMTFQGSDLRSFSLKVSDGFRWTNNEIPNKFSKFSVFLADAENVAIQRQLLRNDWLNSVELFCTGEDKNSGLVFLIFANKYKNKDYVFTCLFIDRNLNKCHRITNTVVSVDEGSNLTPIYSLPDLKCLVLRQLSDEDSQIMTLKFLYFSLDRSEAIEQDSRIVVS